METVNYAYATEPYFFICTDCGETEFSDMLFIETPAKRRVIPAVNMLLEDGTTMFRGCLYSLYHGKDVAYRTELLRAIVDYVTDTKSGLDSFFCISCEKPINRHHEFISCSEFSQEFMKKLYAMSREERKVWARGYKANKRIQEMVLSKKDDPFV